MTRTVLATANVQKDLPLDVARSAVATVLIHRPDVIALQEWGRQRDSILRDLDGYAFARPSCGGGPIAFTSRFALVRCRGVVLARRSFVGRLAGRKSTLPESVANVTVLHDDAVGDDVTFVNAHLTAEVQKAGRYRRDLAHLPRVMRHKRERRRLERLVRRQVRRGRRVFVLLDGNFDGLQVKGLVSCWEGRAGGTLGKRAVDIIAGPVWASSVRTLDIGSDHRAVVATFKEQP